MIPIRQACRQPRQEPLSGPDQNSTPDADPRILKEISGPKTMADLWQFAREGRGRMCSDGHSRYSQAFVNAWPARSRESGAQNLKSSGDFSSCRFDSRPGSPQLPEAHRSYPQRLDVPQARFLGPDDQASEVLTNGNNPVLPKPMTAVDAPSYSRRRKAASKEGNEKKTARKREMPRRRSRKESNFPHRPEGGAGSKRRST